VLREGFRECRVLGLCDEIFRFGTRKDALQDGTPLKTWDVAYYITNFVYITGFLIFFASLYKIPTVGKTIIDISNWKGGFSHVKEQEKPSTGQSPALTGTNAGTAKKTAASWSDEQ